MNAAALSSLPRRPRVSGAALGSGRLLALACIWLLSLTFVWSTPAMVLSATAIAIALTSEATLRGSRPQPLMLGLLRVTRLAAWLIAFAVTGFYCLVTAVVWGR